MNVDWLTPWHPITNADVQRGLIDELHRELPRDHPLHDLVATPLARRQDCDDVLFTLSDGRVAIVHLTWSGKTEVGCFPWTSLFDSINTFIDQAMKPEHLNWE